MIQARLVRLFAAGTIAAMGGCEHTGDLKPSSDPHHVLRVRAAAGMAWTIDIRYETGAGVSHSGTGTGEFSDSGFGRTSSAGSVETLTATGSFAGTTFEFGYVSRNGGSAAESGSFQNLSGPGAVVSPCSIAYTEGAGTQQFRAQFRTTGDSSTVCRTP